MADDELRLSYEELDDILKRSTALQARRGSAMFTKQDLFDAAKELGIDGKTAAEVVDAHFACCASTKLAPRPFDTRVELTVTPDLLALSIPPLRPSLKHLAPLGFVGFWFAFIACWTAGAAQGSTLFALFSLPFWAAGVGMLARFVLPLVQKTRLTLGRDGGELVISPFGKRRALRTSELRVRIGDYVRHRHKGMAVEKEPGQALLLEHGVQTMALLDGFSEQEQRWIESELAAWLPNP